MSGAFDPAVPPPDSRPSVGEVFSDLTADFSTLNLTGNPTVTLDGAQTIGNLRKRPAEVGRAAVIEVNRESVRSSPHEFCAPECCEAPRNFSVPTVGSYRNHNFRRFEFLQICK